jgi:phospholipid/cholesterol/gamma-HCH transport system substrate-binding protein
VTAIRKHWLDFVAIIGLILVALVVAGVILANQRLAVPGWVPVLGSDYTEVEAELASAQAVTPGQGQTVNVAGVEVGEISRVRLEAGKAIVTLRLDEGTVPVYRDASVLLRPKTGLKDMVAELTPGTKAAGELESGQRIPIGQTLPDVNLDEILSALDGDTRAYLQMLLTDGGEALKGNGRNLADTFRRFEPLARDTRKLAEGLADRQANIKRAIHNFSLVIDALGDKDDQLAEFVENSNAVFAAFARQDANLRSTISELPSTLTETQSALSKTDTLARELGPTLQALRPGARALGPTLRQMRPFLRETTPVIREEIRPFVRASRPAVKELRPAVNNLAALTPDLLKSFKVVNKLVNTLAYNPPGDDNEGYLFWASWLNHLGPAIFSNSDAHGPIRRGLVVVGCQSIDTLKNIVLGNPQLGVLTQLLALPDANQVCPQTAQSPGTG